MEPTEAGDMLATAGRMQAEVRRRGRWYPPWLVAFAAMTVVLVGTLPLQHGLAAIPAAVLLVAAIYGLRSVADRRPVWARGGTGRQVVMMVVWLALYLAAVFWVGPAWFAGDVGLWLLGGVVVALPPLVEAVLAWRRLRR